MAFDGRTWLRRYRLVSHSEYAQSDLDRAGSAAAHALIAVPIRRTVVAAMLRAAAVVDLHDVLQREMRAGRHWEAGRVRVTVHR
jgi:hypothetical protein